ncbi:EAL domain-containing protein [Williamsia sp. CHRR-6]|uniref:sensor domain-containing phosphodiesterase n=1 Tax=Williamsia sp. CHRR-6 TaxID=2835871 RepID=UPI001BDA9527|nr:EAL domain-containing protein [Williamsia sp. CHRR-6]MBT0568554.1 EAL domain-containing protein [Williamsia sp. CHRR-6]
MTLNRPESRGGPAGNYTALTRVSPVLTSTLELAANALGYPIAAVHILDDRQQFVLASYGTPDGRVGSVSGRDETICSVVVDSGEPVMIPDATDASVDRRCAQPVLDSDLRSYAGVPLFSREHTAIGTLCLGDPNPNELTETQMSVLGKYGRVIEEQLELQRDRAASTARYSVDDVLEAMDAGQISPWFQAIVDPRTREIRGYEALSRWMHPDHGLVGPAEFLPAIASTDIVLDLDLDMLARAATMMMQTCPDNRTSPLHVNVDGAHLERRYRLDMLIEAITSSPFPTELIRVELIESATLDDASAAASITRLRETGAQVVIDDLGRGWSSLSRMINWPIDGFKIDASLTAGLGTPMVDHLLTGLVEHAEANHLLVIAEGIETDAQVHSLNALNCPLAQGYRFQVPQPAPSALAD